MAGYPGADGILDREGGRNSWGTSDKKTTEDQLTN